MNAKELHELDLAITKAKEIAYKAIENETDWGCCNFDHPIVKVGRTMQKDIDAMANDTYKDYRCKSLLHIMTEPVGQANRNTKFAEAMRKHLEELGYTTYVHYQMD